MNKPVAWISRLPEGDVYNCAWAEKQNDDDIPLYTHPVKELKNIVVASATCSCGKVMEVTNLQPVKKLTDEEILNMAADKFHYSEYRLVVEFARAILRKAQKK